MCARTESHATTKTFSNKREQKKSKCSLLSLCCGTKKHNHKTHLPIISCDWIGAMTISSRHTHTHTNIVTTTLIQMWIPEAFSCGAFRVEHGLDNVSSFPLLARFPEDASLFIRQQSASEANAASIAAGERRHQIKQFHRSLESHWLPRPAPLCAFVYQRKPL